MSVASTILRRVRGRGRGTVFTAQDFFDLGSRATVDQALARLSRAGQVRRLDRGVYDLPRLHSRIGPMWPSADTVAQAVARQTGSRLQPTGAAAANVLGLSTQVPARAEFLTDGPSRNIRVGELVVRLKHAGRVAMLLPQSRAGMVIVALHHLGREAAMRGAIEHLSATLDDSDKQQLRRVRLRLPGWLRAALDQFIGGVPAHG